MAGFDSPRPGIQAVANSVTQLIDAWSGKSGHGVAMSLTNLSSSAYALTLRNLNTLAGGHHLRVLKSDDPTTVLLNVTDSGLQIASLFVTNALGLPAGTASLPGLFVTGDTNTGLYSPGADQLSVSTGGTARAHFSASGLVIPNGFTLSAGTLTLPTGSVRGTYLTDNEVTAAKLATGAATGAVLGSDVATLLGIQTLTNKTLTSPSMSTVTITSGGIAVTAGGIAVTAGGIDVTSGQIKADATGGAATPGYAFHGQTGYGLYFATNQAGIAVGAAKGLIVDNNKNVFPGGDPGTIATSATGPFQYVTGGAGVPTGAPTNRTANSQYPMYYDPGSGIIYVHNGTAWAALNAIATAITANGTANTDTNVSANRHVTIASNLDSGADGDILFQNAGTTRAKIPYLATSGGVLDLLQAATPANPSASFNRTYFKSDNYAYHIDPTGSESQFLDQKTWLPQNPIINGGFEIWQRGTSFTSIANGAYGPDRFIYAKAGAVVHDLIQEAADLPSIAALVELPISALKLNVTTADNSIAAGDFCVVGQRLEGYVWAPFAQKQFTVGFWVKDTITGPHYLAALSGASDRSCVISYTINTTNTWEYKTVTFPASPSAGTWNYLTGLGLQLYWTLSCGTTFQTTAGAWQTGNFLGASDQINSTSSTSNSFKLWGVTIGLGPTVAPYWPRPYPIELALCQRYFETITTVGGSGISIGSGLAISSTLANITWAYRVTKRALPSIAGSGTFIVWNGSAGALSGTSTGASFSGLDSANIQFSVSSGLTTGQATLVACNSTGGTMTASSEL